MLIYRKHLIWLLAASFWLCACQPEMIPLPVVRVTLTPSAVLPQPGGMEGKAVKETLLSTPFTPAVQALVDQAKADLAQRLSVEAGTIEVAGASAVTWPDGSLGCPKPGMAYTMMLVDGLRIRLKAGGAVYEYHSGGSQPPFLCQ